MDRRIKKNNSLLEYLTNMQTQEQKSTEANGDKLVENGCEEDVPTEHSTVTDDEEDNDDIVLGGRGEGGANDSADDAGESRQEEAGETRQEEVVIHVSRQSRSEYEAAKRRRRQQEAAASMNTSKKRSETGADVPPKPAQRTATAQAGPSDASSHTIQRNNVRSFSAPEALLSDDDSSHADDQSVRSTKSNTVGSGTVPKTQRVTRESPTGSSRNTKTPNTTTTEAAQVADTDASNRKGIVRPTSAHNRLVPRGARGLGTSSHRKDSDKPGYAMLRSQHKGKEDEKQNSSERSTYQALAKESKQDGDQINNEYIQLQRQVMKSPGSPSKQPMTPQQIRNAMIQVENTNGLPTIPISSSHGSSPARTAYKSVESEMDVRTGNAMATMPAVGVNKAHHSDELYESTSSFPAYLPGDNEIRHHVHQQLGRPPPSTLGNRNITEEDDVKRLVQQQMGRSISNSPANNHVIGDDEIKRQVQQQLGRASPTSPANDALEELERASNHDIAYAIKAGYVGEYTEAQRASNHAPSSSSHASEAAHSVLKREHAKLVGGSARDYENDSDSDAENIDAFDDGFAYDTTSPGAHDVPAPSITPLNRRDDMVRYDSYLTSRDQYLTTAVLVTEEADEGETERKLAREKSERFRMLEQRQEALENQIEEQKHLIQTHQDELTELKGNHGEIVQAQVIAPDNDEIARQIRQQERIIAEQEAELNSLIDRSRSGLGLLRKELRKKGGGFMSKFNPFRKNTDTIPEDFAAQKRSFLSSSEHSRTTSATIRSPSVQGNGGSISLSEHISSFALPPAAQMSTESIDSFANSRDQSERSESMGTDHNAVLGTQKREERFIAPEKLPFEDRSISELKKLARDSKVDISGCFDREQIVQQLLDGGVKPRKKGPLNKLFGGNKTKSPKATTKAAPKSPTKTRPAEAKEKIDVPPPDMPVPNLSEKRASVFVPKQSDKFENFSTTQLKKIALDRGIDVSTCTDRSDLASLLYSAGMRPSGQGDPARDTFDKLSVSELKRIAASNGVDISSCVEKSQIVGALRVAGVRPPKSKSHRTQESFHDYSISKLKRLADQANLDVSACVEKNEIIAVLRQAGVKPASGSAPRLCKDEFSGWRPSQLRMLASHIKAPVSGLGEDALVAGILEVANEEQKSLRSPIRSIARFAVAPLHKLRAFSKQKRIDISGCVERDEILQRIISKCVP